MRVILSPLSRPIRWIGLKLQPRESFKLTEDGALLRCFGKHVVERLDRGDITKWQVILEPGADVVVVGLKVGLDLLWSDPGCKLIELFKRFAPEFQGKDLTPEEMRPVKVERL